MSPLELVTATVARLADLAPGATAPDLADKRLIADLGFDSVRLVELVLELNQLGLPISLDQVLAHPDLDVRALTSLAPSAAHPTRTP